MAGRPPVPRDLKVKVYFRDLWLCHLCHRPVVFPPAFKLLEEFVRSALPGVPVAYFNANSRRDKAPLLDELGACIDHVEPFSTGGAHDGSNLKTACGRCNTRKSARSKEQFLTEARPWKVKGLYGEPKDWDGMASTFVALARRASRTLTAAERDWLRSLEAYYDSQGRSCI